MKRVALVVVLCVLSLPMLTGCMHIGVAAPEILSGSEVRNLLSWTFSNALIKVHHGQFLVLSFEEVQCMISQIKLDYCPQIQPHTRSIVILGKLYERWGCPQIAAGLVCYRTTPSGFPPAWWVVVIVRAWSQYQVWGINPITMELFPVPPQEGNAEEVNM